MPDPYRRVAILYSHSLLGEGLAKLLGGDRHIRVELLHTDDLDAAEAALTTQPEVVIVERGLHVRAIDLLGLAPNALVIDVGLDAGPTWAYHRDELPQRPEDLLRAIRHRTRGPLPRRCPEDPIPAAR